MKKNIYLFNFVDEKVSLHVIGQTSNIYFETYHEIIYFIEHLFNKEIFQKNAKNIDILLYIKGIEHLLNNNDKNLFMEFDFNNEFWYYILNNKFNISVRLYVDKTYSFCIKKIKSYHHIKHKLKHY